MLQVRIQPIIVIALAALLAFSYNNCSKVKFASNPESLRAKLDSGGGIIINNDETFTRLKDVQLSVNNTDANEMYITNDASCQSGGSWEPLASLRAWQLGSSNTETQVYAKFRNTASPEIESDCVSDEIIHDDVPPVVVVTDRMAIFINKTQTSVDFMITDAVSGVSDANCEDDTGNTVDCFDRHSRTGLIEGAHFLRISARDRAGNAAAPTMVNYFVDLTPPVLTFNLVPPKITNDLHGDFQFSARDSLSGVGGYECRTSSSGTFQACTSPFGRDFSEGPQQVSVRAIDVAGNASAEQTYDWVIDRSAPAVRITSHPDPFTSQTTGNFTFDGTDGDGTPLTVFECALDAGAYTSCTSPRAETGLSEGSHTFLVRGTDKAGNKSAPATYTWIVDLTKPTVTITSGPSGVSNSAQADFAFTATDTVSGIARTECQIDNGGYQACTSPKNYATLADGEHRFDVRAVDNAGNISDPATRIWKVDTIKPVLEILSGPQLLTNSDSAEFTMRATDTAPGTIARIECKRDTETTFGICVSPKVYAALDEGSHLFSARAVDSAGNVSDVKTYAWQIDRSGPAINFTRFPLTTIGIYEAAITEFTVTDAPAGVDTITCGLNGASSACLAQDSKNFGYLAVGAYSFTVVAKDKLGNESSKTINWNAVDNTISKIQDVTVNGPNKKVDVLVVIDNSGSMKTEQANMADRFSTFLDQLNGLDWQLAIVTTDVTKDVVLKDGRFIQFTNYPTSPAPYILTSAMNGTQARTSFASTIQRPENEGSANEQGIAATYRSVQRSQLTGTVNAPNRAFFRAGAALAVLVVTDADETNPNGTEEKNKPESLLNLVRTTFAGKTFVYHSIIVKPGDAVCKGKNANEDYGYSYDAMSKLTGGIVGSVCETDYGSQLAGIGQGVRELVRSVTLDCLPLDKTGDGIPDIVIETGDMSPAPTYTIDGVKLTTATALPVGTNHIKYSCLKPVVP